MTFENIQEAVRAINEMEEIFDSISIYACHYKKINQFTTAKWKAINILIDEVKPVVYDEDEKK